MSHHAFVQKTGLTDRNEANIVSKAFPRIAFILGAGASAPCGAPTMCDFLERTRMEIERGQLPRFRRDLDNVLVVKDYLFTHQTKAAYPVDNMESLFSAIEMGMTLGRLGTLSLEQIAAAKDSFIRLTAAMLEHTMPLSRHGATSLPTPRGQPSGSGIFAPRGYNELGLFIKGLLEKNFKSEIDIISFNYDLGVELGLMSHRVDFSTVGTPAPEPLVAKVSLHKLHGSILWENAGNAIVNHIGALKDELHTLLYGTAIEEPEELVQASPSTSISLQCVRSLLARTSPLFMPLLVPPTDQKASHRATMTEVWKSAAESLSAADVICIVGYSIPPTDVFFKCLWAISCSSDHELRRIYVADRSQNPFNTIRSMVGTPIQSRITHVPGSLREAVLQIQDDYQRTHGTWLGLS